MSNDNTRYDKIQRAFKNNRLSVVLISVAVVVIGVATTLDSITRIGSFFGFQRDKPNIDSTTTMPPLNSGDKTSADKIRSIASPQVELSEETGVDKRCLVIPQSADPSGEISVNTIIRTFRDAPAIRHPQMQDYFVGQQIDWSLYLGSVRQTEYGYFIGALPLDPAHNEPIISFLVPLEGNEKLSLAAEGDTIRIKGKLREANQFHVWIEDVELVSLRSKKHNEKRVIQPPLDTIRNSPPSEVSIASSGTPPLPEAFVVTLADQTKVMVVPHLSYHLTDKILFLGSVGGHKKVGHLLDPLTKKVSIQVLETVSYSDIRAKRSELEAEARKRISEVTKSHGYIVEVFTFGTLDKVKRELESGKAN